jgi:hypothetical protein
VLANLNSLKSKLSQTESGSQLQANNYFSLTLLASIIRSDSHDNASYNLVSLKETCNWYRIVKHEPPIQSHWCKCLRCKSFQITPLDQPASFPLPFTITCSDCEDILLTQESLYRLTQQQLDNCNFLWYSDHHYIKTRLSEVLIAMLSYDQLISEILGAAPGSNIKVTVPDFSLTTLKVKYKQAIMELGQFAIPKEFTYNAQSKTITILRTLSLNEFLGHDTDHAKDNKALEHKQVEEEKIPEDVQEILDKLAEGKRLVLDSSNSKENDNARERIFRWARKLRITVTSFNEEGKIYLQLKRTRIKYTIVD